MKKAKDRSRVETNLVYLETAGLSLDELKSTFQGFKKDQKKRNQLISVLVSRSLMKPEMSRVLSQWVKVNRSHPDQPFRLSLEDLTGSPAGLGIARWKPAALHGIANVMKRTVAILEKSPSKKLNDAFQEAEKEYGIVGKAAKGCRLCQN